MKYAAYGLLAAFLASGVHGAIPDTASGWYTPSGGKFETKDSYGEVWYFDEDGGWTHSEVTVDENGKVTDWEGDIDILGAAYPAYQAMLSALKAETIAKQNTERIKTIGKNLDNLRTSGISIENVHTKQKFTVRFGSSIGSTEQGGPVPATSNAKDPADRKSLDWTSGGRLELRGWEAQASSGNILDVADSVDIPVRVVTGDANMMYRTWSGIDDLTLAKDLAGKIGIKDWDSAPSGLATPLAGVLTKPVSERDMFDDYKIVVRNSIKGLNYVDIGVLDASGMSVDGESISTNETDGAASLYGWADADAEDFPRKGSDGHLEWKSPEDLVDGSSIAWAEVDGGKKFEVKDAHVYAGQHSRHYFGTSNDKTAALGWHELPNVTTNRVEGDNITIASTVDEQDPGIKRLGLLGWNKNWGGDPLFVVNAGGSVGYIPLPALTNLAACACSNKWTRTLEWIGDGEVGDDGLTFESADLDHYLYGTLGYIYSTTPGNLHFDNDGEQIEASFDAPANWADGDSVELTDDGKYQIKGFSAAGACEANVSAMLSQPSGSDATTHLFLAKKTDSGELHYVSIGDGVKAGAEVDDTTITTNALHGAVSSGSASIYGWSIAANDTYLSKNESGNLEWRKIDAVPGVDGESVVTNTAKELTLRGYAAADVGAVPQKTAQGLSWLKASSATNVILAGAGINITDNGGGAITISTLDSATDSTYGTHTITVVTSVQYNESSHKFQKKTRTITFNGVVGSESDWTDVFETVSHKSEHSQEESSP